VAVMPLQLIDRAQISQEIAKEGQDSYEYSTHQVDALITSGLIVARLYFLLHYINIVIYEFNKFGSYCLDIELALILFINL
jgi:hypothetical protein